jgi:hypothetical protein
MSLADMRIYTDEELANPSPIDAYTDLVRITRPATREDVLAAVRELGAVEVKVESGVARLEELDYIIDGLYLIIPLDTGDTTTSSYQSDSDLVVGDTE